MQLFFLFIVNESVQARVESDTLGISIAIDSSLIENDSIQADSIEFENDSLPKEKQMLEEPVFYNAEDSIAFNIDTRTVEMYKDAKVDYQGKKISAALIEFNMLNETVVANGTTDSVGKPIGIPVFEEKDEKFQAKKISYNFKTRKGYIRAVKSEQDGGTLHGEYTKRQANEHIHIKEGKYSTCELDHPHFYIRLTKAMSIPDDKIVAGFSHLVVADIPLPLFVPFGFFPSTKSYKSGILLPNYGEDRRGFYLRDGGYYWAINQYMDATITTEFFSRGSWGVSPSLRYQKKYSYNGNFNGSYSVYKFGEIGASDYEVQKLFSIVWNHAQDAKANPFQNFSASVNFSSANSDKFTSRSIEEVVQTTKASSINFSRSWANSPFRLTSRINISQNSSTKDVVMGLPQISFTMSRINPFKNKENEGGDEKWYEKFELTYTSNFDNDMSTKDSLLFKNNMFDKKRSNWGFKHSVPFSYPIKLLSFVTLSPSLQYEGYVYGNYIKKTYNTNYFDSVKNVYGRMETDTIYDVNYIHGYAPVASLSVTPNFTGMYMFKYGRVKAIRHLLKPQASISFVPDMSDIMATNMEYIRNSDGSIYYNSKDKKEEYSRYIGRYGVPRGSSKSAMVSLSFINSLEMKYLKKTDTADFEQKVVLLDNISATSSYNIFVDSMNWSNINISASTKLFKDKFSVNFTATLDPYVLNNKNVRTKKYEVFNNHKYLSLGRMVNYNISLGTSLNPEGNKNNVKQVIQPVNNALPNQPQTILLPQYADFEMSWNANISYDLNYSKNTHAEALYTQTLRVSGDYSVTEKWKFGYSTGWDFELKQMSITSLNVMRDLHCWVMTFSWVPFGMRQSFNFQINAKSSLLQDLKYNKNKYWYDNL